MIVLVPFSESRPTLEYNHRHEAAGSSSGGRFAKSGGEGGWPEGDRALTPDQNKARDQWRTQVEDWANQVAKELGFTAKTPEGSDRVVITDTPVTQFEVAGVKMGEGGHYDPRNGCVYINANAFKGWSAGDKLGAERAIKGIAAHEIQHAMYEVFRTAMDVESKRLLGMTSSEVNAFMRPSGEIRPEKRGWFNETFPAHAAVEDTWGSGWTSSNRVSNRMREADGCSDYSRLYWTAAGQPGGELSSYTNYLGSPQSKGKLDRAVDETLAEVAKYRVLQKSNSVEFRTTGGISNGIARENVPSRDWQKFQNRVRSFYHAHVKGGGRG